MQEVLAKPGNQDLPLSEQEFYELRIDDSTDPEQPGFVVMQSRATWSEADKGMVWDEIEREHWIMYQAAKNRYAARRQVLMERGFTESDMDLF
ncbi:MAG TPA: hypothetical protein VGF96_15795 [Terracidiphilus sp.]|jgi:hypothetical protein